MRMLYASMPITIAIALSTSHVGPRKVEAAGAPITLGGIVKLDGPAPHRAPINMAKEPGCAAFHKSPALTEDVVAGSSGALKNVVIYVSEGLPDSSWEPPQDAKTLDQHGCLYEPHVVALQTGQQLRIVNSDKNSHNIHPMPFVNREWNKSQPSGAPVFEETFAREEVGLPVKCNVHSWMRAYIAVFRHPYFSVTDDAGTFQIKNLPAGTYTITAWHEKLGTSTQKVTAGAGETKTLQFVFKARAGV